jgi:hypothetical protein
MDPGGLRLQPGGRVGTDHPFGPVNTGAVDDLFGGRELLEAHGGERVGPVVTPPGGTLFPSWPYWWISMR